MSKPKKQQHPAEKKVFETMFKDAWNKFQKNIIDKPKRLAELEKYLHHLVLIYLDEWKEQVDTAITDAQPPALRASQRYWFIALAGNLLWAATCFVNPTSLIVIRVMSVAGGLVAAGTIEKMVETGDKTPKDGRGVVREAIAKKRWELEKIFLPMVKQWALELDNLALNPNNLETVDLDVAVLDSYVWKQMFPPIPFEERFHSIYKLSLEKITATLADYNRQYKVWVEKSGFEIGQEEVAVFFKWYAKDHPFTPKLNLYIPTK
jgi:hypothetical protein